MTVAPGTALGPYEIRESIGAGATGELFRAFDPRLRREVAVRVLPYALSDDAEALARIEREAWAVASIDHPNVHAIHDVGKEGARAFLVTESLEGETLRERLARAPLPPPHALRLGIEVARGLAAAHEKGIVHRDLKPENVFLTRDGRVKLLDFGLGHPAHAATPSTSCPDAADPRLLDPAATVGTPAYMSPEQARGLHLDGRSDVFSLGVLLYEMLAGALPFRGAGAHETMLAVARDEPPALPPERGIPPSLERITLRCLEKDREARFQSASDLAFALETLTDLAPRAPGASRPGASGGGRALRLLGGAALLGAGLSAGLLVSRPRSPEAPAPPTVLRPLTYSGSEAGGAASPDGRLLAFSSGRSGGSRIWLKQLAGGAESPLTSGPEDSAPAFSPHGDELLFLRGSTLHDRLYRIGVLGGEALRIADDVAGAAFLPPDGAAVVFLRRLAEGPPVAYGLFVADRDGGNVREVTRTSHEILTSPRPSPDGRSVAVVAIPGTANRGSSFLVFPLDGGPPRRLPAPKSLGRLWAPSWSGDGRSLVYCQVSSVRYGGSRLFVQPLGGAPRAILGAPFELRATELLGGGRVAVDATLVRAGLREGPVGGRLPRVSSGVGVDRQPVYSPDGQWLTFSSNRSGELEIWSLSLADGGTRRLTGHPSDDWDPGYTRDGRLVWSSGRSGNLEIWIADADGSSARQLTRDGVDAENPTSTPDGWVVYRSGNPSHPGIWKVREDGSQATLLVPDPTLCPETSPDGRHVAYIVPALPGPEAILRVARTEDGAPVPFEIRLPLTAPTDIVVGRPRWLADGSAIAFLSMDAQGRLGIEAQDFRPGTDTTRTRRRIAGFLPEDEVETFAFSPDGRLAFSTIERRSELYLVEGLPGLPEKAPSR